MDERPHRARPPEDPGRETGRRVWPPEGAGRGGRRARPAEDLRRDDGRAAPPLEEAGHGGQHRARPRQEPERGSRRRARPSEGGAGPAWAAGEEPERGGAWTWPAEEPERGGRRRARPVDGPGRGGGRPWAAEEAEPGSPRARPVGEPEDGGGRGSAVGVPPDDLPPSARWYGTPAAPPRSRLPGRLRRRLLALTALAAGAGTVAVAAVVLAPRVLPAAPPPAVVSDRLAGVGYPLPEGWRAGTVPPVTEFTAVAGRGGEATVMSRPAEPVTDVRKATVELADIYARLLLHGDEVEVVDDRAVTVGGRSGHSRALRAEYRDVVNRPAYLRVVFLTGAGGRPVVVVGMAQPDDPRLRAEIDTVISGVR
ncbi:MULTISPECIES: hypothetical protein [Streptosporangium]|uniref:DUF1795 domain-containing protein n=1 Tax=Streptosporangium brasiliense TaxID=47480 RepID=A0ABT9QV05_9ACTN|nr:hypothetical protein [Streptosporangium brasiliense]MDP9860821.1 hypothetical protein [Streptosporangium brasiliense]